MSSAQLRRSARIAARRKATTLDATLILPGSPEHPLQESAAPTAQDVLEADSSSSDRFHVEAASDTLYHRILWRKASKIGHICFLIAILARIVLFMGQRLPRGSYHEISLLNDLFNAVITQSVLSHILTYHDLQPLLAAHKSFHLPIHHSVLEYARYHRLSSLLPVGSPWLFLPVARRYLINSTEHNYTDTQFDRVPWVNFHEDLVDVLGAMSDDLLWFAENASASDLFTTEVANSEGWATKSKNTHKTTDFQYSESSTDGSLKMEEAVPWCFFSQSLPCDDKNIPFDSLLHDLNKTIKTAEEYWLESLHYRLNWVTWINDSYGLLSSMVRYLDDRLDLWEKGGIWLGLNRSGMQNSDKPRIECLMRHNSSSQADVFKACDKFIPPTVDFASAQIQNSTAQDMIQIIKLFADTSQSISRPETYLSEFKSHLEEVKRVTGGLIRHVEEVLFYFDIEKMQLREAWHEGYRARLECRLARLDKALLFLREIALTRLEDQIDRAVLTLLVAKDFDAQRQHIQGTIHDLQSPSSWILPPHLISLWWGYLHSIMGLTPYTSRRLVFPSLERMLADAKEAAWWVGKLIDYDKFLEKELSNTFEVAKFKDGKSYSLLYSRVGLVDCKVRIVSRWHAADQGKRLDAFAYDGNNCFLHLCIDEGGTESLKRVHHGWWDHITRWIF
ncbi:unnamed protein product [Clonostachys rhizophaga]|uniref:Uncharacterized protein n=1 Tax=Clonostachys rhizophaga TaxID=160324 RepID=A0A9N9VU02_9HYPO|nr:unnamed protein product [Clonostachys rhizophaga]